MRKVCNKCNIEKDLVEFHPNKGGKFGVRSRCKICERKTQKEQYNPDKKREYYVKNKEHIIKYQEQYREKNPEKILQDRKDYYQKNKERLVQYAVDYKKQKRESDPVFRMMENIRRRIQLAYKNHYKSKSTMELLGCTGEELAQHLEKQFQEGMTHENHGEWHIDHIKPIALFDLSDPEQEQECFHYTNLQPLWATDNMRKKDKLM